MICVPLPHHRSSGPRMLPPGRPEPRSDSVGARADALLDEVFIDLANAEVQRGLMRLLTGLAELRRRASRPEWRRFSDETWVRHPVSSQFLDLRIREAAMRVGGPRAGLAALLSLLSERTPPAISSRRRR
ncbi:MAG: hypothetical protein OEM67_02365 [Thermoleophilia bacterium]|nr:hypothetical protein [Thermoleophilia bacterium]